MRFFSFPFLTSALLLLALCQPGVVWGRVDTLRAFPEKRFVNGAKGFGEYLMHTLRYPLQAHQSATLGTSVVSFILTPTGKLSNVAIVNPLGTAIDDEVVRVIRQTRKLWRPADQPESQDSVRLFLQITFQLGTIKFYVEPVRPDFILNDIIVVGYSSQLPYNAHDDPYYVSELNAAAQNNDFKQMLRILDELIRRNPYSDKLYFQRARIEQELGQTEAACTDYKKIVYFLGRTSFPKKFLENCADFSATGTRTTLVQASSESSSNEEIFTVCEVPPSFPGKLTDLQEYLRQNLRYPEAALNAKVRGKVMTSFIVTKEGYLQDIEVLKGPGYGINEEAVRLIRNMPKWNPGKQAGRPVNVKYLLVIPFRSSDLN